jgi:hypothetical protein
MNFKAFFTETIIVFISDWFIEDTFAEIACHKFESRVRSLIEI